jgi:hypothetical protein
MQTKVVIDEDIFWLDQPEVTRLEVLRLLGYSAGESVNQILNERGKTYDSYPNISAHRAI